MSAAEAPCLYVAPTREMLFWARVLRPILSPTQDSWLRRTMRTALVTPIAHFANLSLEFQSYLYDVFHQRQLTRVAHVVCMPLITTAMLAAVGEVNQPALGVCAVLLTAGYWAQALAARAPGLGVAMTAVTGVLTVIAHSWAYAALGGSVYASPVIWMFVAAAVQSGAHAVEPCLPPRVSLSDRWTPMRVFVLGDGTRHDLRTQMGRVVRLGLAGFWGTFDEWWAGPRLLTVIVLNVLWSCGYQPAMRVRCKSLSRRALEEGNPALDFIGTGGGVTRTETGWVASAA